MRLFLDIFRPNPGNTYLLVTTKIDTIADALFEKIDSAGGRFRIALYGEGAFAKAEKIEYIDSFTKPFRALPRDNDRVIFYDIFAYHRDPEQLLKIAYRTLANSAEIVIVEKHGLLDLEKTAELLENNEYRAPAHMGDVLQGYDVFTARKMHMWGNGL